MCKIADWTVLLLLGIISLWDYRRKEIPVVFLGIMGMCVLIFRVLGNSVTMEGTMGGVLIGIGFFIMAKITKEAVGYGDCFLILLLGIYKGGFAVLQMILSASIMTALFAIGFCMCTGWRREVSIPFAPFLFAAYLGVIIL